MTAPTQLEKGKVILVTNNSDEINGDTSSVSALLNSPGADGISLRETLFAIRKDPGEYTIRFDPKLKGSTIKVGSWNPNQFPPLEDGNLTINGDVDDDEKANITLENDADKPTPNHNIYGFQVHSSGNTINALKLVGFSIGVLFDTPSTHPIYDDISIYDNAGVGSKDNLVEFQKP